MKSIETTFNKDIIEILHLQKDYNNQKKSLQKELQLGIIDVDSFSEEMTNLSKKEIQLKQKTVFSYHVTSNGTPKVIAQYGPNRRNLWHTKVSKGKIITAKSYEELINKLFTYYTGGLNDYSVHSIFEAALLEKQVSDNPKQGTINKNVNDYKRFINDEFSITDIHEINSLYVKKYTQSLVKSKKLSENAFLAYKGILNLIFGYAISEHIISTNPVDEIKNSVYLKDCYVPNSSAEAQILSPEEIELVKKKLRETMNRTFYHGYCYNAYPVLMAIETGMRAGELCSLKWSDIDYNNSLIHIHTQLLETKIRGSKTTWYEAPYTKDEKKGSKNGRFFPLTNEIISILEELKTVQKNLGISSQYIFVKRDGSWITTSAYEKFVLNTCRSIGLNVTNNHAFRKSLNSNVLVPLGFTAPQRAKMLGHSVETNLKYYTFENKGYIDEAREILNKFNATKK